MTFLRNQWYCAGFSDDLKEAPVAVKILGEPIVLYRASGGKAVALQDRCPHRFAPLSKGRICGANIECPYHGLEFGADGHCTKNPWGDHRIPTRARVRSYPMVERDMFLWIWMGAPEQAREDGVLDLTSFFNALENPVVSGGYLIAAHYEVVIDNLMDLSHAFYLHRGTLTNAASVASNLVVQTREEGDSVVALHRRDRDLPTPFFQPVWAGRTERVDHRSDMHWRPAANLVHDIGITEPGQPQGPNDGIYLHIAHILTPISERETYYRWIAARNFSRDSEAAGEALRRAIDYAFTNEDQPMLGVIQERMGTTDLMSLEPVILPGDASAIRTRRITDRLRKAEAAASSSGT